jgi:hypothetical protein
VLDVSNRIVLLKLLARWNHGKFQAAKSKFQINTNDPNSKFQTNGSAAVAPNGIITDNSEF